MNATILSALQLAYRKHHLDDDNVGWEELSDALCHALCEAMGDEGFQRWSAEMDASRVPPPVAWGAGNVAPRSNERGARTRDFA